MPSKDSRAVMIRRSTLSATAVKMRLLCIKSCAQV